MASEFDVYSFVKGQFGVEIVGQGKNGTYDTVHLYIQPFSKNNDRLAIDEYVGRYAETPSWSKIFALSENDLSDAIKIYNNYVVSSDRIDIHMIDKEIYKEVKMRLDDVFEIKESKKSIRKSLKESFDKFTVNTLRGELMKLGYWIDDLLDLPSKRHANEVIRQAETVINFCESTIYELKNAIKNNEV